MFRLPMLESFAKYPMQITLVFLLASALLVHAGCSDSQDNVAPTFTPTPASTQAVEATSTLIPTPTQPAEQDTPLASPACPIDVTICDFAALLLPIIAAGDVDAFMALAEPVPVICTGSQGLGGPSQALCESAALDETRFGYWDTQAGEGLVVTEAEFRSTLERWFSRIPEASGEDDYGPGELRVGSVACARLHSEPSGTCSQDRLLIHFTLISPATDPSEGIGIPGERTTFHVRLHEASGGNFRIDGFGQSVPPNAALDAFSLDAQTDEGDLVLLEFYPWTP